MSNLNLKPLAWALFGAGVAVMGNAGAFDLPSWLHHSKPEAAASATANGGGGGSTGGSATHTVVAAASPIQPVALVNPAQPPLPALPPGTAPNYRAIVQQYGPAVVHVSVSGSHKPTQEEIEENGMGPDNPLMPFFRGMPGFPRGMQPGEQPFKGLGSGFIVS